jgi:hypothetical protein
MKRYLIVFWERDLSISTAFEKIGEEEYDLRQDAVNRFNKAIEASHNTANAVEYKVFDNNSSKTIASFTFIPE